MLDGWDTVFACNQNWQRQFHGVSEAKPEKEEIEGSQHGWGLMVTPQRQPPRMNWSRKAELSTGHVSLQEHWEEGPESSSRG